MNILIASSEMTPLAKSGGLADVISALPKKWLDFGQKPIVVLPKYSFIDTEQYGFRPTDTTLYVPMGWWMEYARLWEGTIPDTKVPVYLIENNDYFDRDGIYGDPKEFSDNDRRFIFLSRAVFETAKALQFQPDVLHAHDFHTALTMAFLKSHYRFDPMFAKTAGVFTIHNLAYQGWFNPHRAMDFTGFGMSEFYPGSWFYHRSSFNAMKAGVMFADKITTVSPTYADEIRNKYYGENLHEVLNFRGADLIGVLNGVDYSSWDPETDKLIFKNYAKNEFDRKFENKVHLLNKFGIFGNNEYKKPLIGMVSRLTEQKGIDLLIEILEEYLPEDRFRFVLLGSGDPHFEDYLRYLSSKFAKNALIRIGYNEQHSHRIMAASDFLFVPSRFEPCGLTQMYAMKYGTIPIVRATGGLADTVHEYLPETGEGNGFSFLHYWHDDFSFALNRALRIYGDQPHWNLLRSNAMEEDFSSGKTAMEYIKVYKWAIQKARG